MVMLALITGATSGIGKATAKALWSQGYSVILTGRRSDRLELLKKEWMASAKPHQQIHIATFDLQKSEEISKFLKDFSVHLEKLDVLVNNAGLAKGTDKFQDAKANDWDQMIDTNIKALLHMTRAVLPFMIKNNSGHIINLGSVAGRWVYPGGAIYCATKFAVRALSEGLRQDLLGTNLRVTNIEPGMVETEFSEVRMENKEAAKKVYQGMKPLSAEDIAETIVWCLNRPPHVNIQELVVYPTAQPHVGMVHRT